MLCHTRELAFQISKEYERFSKYMSNVRVGVFFGGVPLQPQVCSSDSLIIIAHENCVWLYYMPEGRFAGT